MNYTRGPSVSSCPKLLNLTPNPAQSKTSWTICPPSSSPPQTPNFSASFYVLSFFHKNIILKVGIFFVKVFPALNIVLAPNKCFW